MEIGGLQKMTLIDYPNRLACTVFTIGCNFRCPFCYSAELVVPEKTKKQPQISKAGFFNFLKERKGLLEGVVICGGEPTIHEELPSFIRKIKKMDYLVKLDTNGSSPERLEKLIQDGLIDYVAMDVKAPQEKYQKVVGNKMSVRKIEKSVKVLKESDVDFEFRTTVVPTLLDKKDIISITRWIGPGGKYYLQSFKPERTVDPKFEKIKPYPDEYLFEIKNAVAPLFDICEVRGV